MGDGKGGERSELSGSPIILPLPRVIWAKSSKWGGRGTPFFCREGGGHLLSTSCSVGQQLGIQFLHRRHCYYCLVRSTSTTTHTSVCTQATTAGGGGFLFDWFHPSFPHYTRERERLAAKAIKGCMAAPPCVNKRCQPSQLSPQKKVSLWGSSRRRRRSIDTQPSRP